MGRYKSKAWSYEKYKYIRYVHSQRSRHPSKGHALCEEVEDYLFRRDMALGSLVAKLLSNDFENRRYSDR